MFNRQRAKNNSKITTKIFRTYRKQIINIFLLIIITLTFLTLTTTCISSSQTQGEELYEQALNLEEQNSFSQAAILYEQAFPVLLEENNLELANKCRESLQRLLIFQMVYPYTIDQLEEVIRQTFPQATAEQIERWITSKEIEHYTWDGEEYYFSDGIQNLKFRNIELIQADEAAEQEYHNLVLKVNNIAQEQPVHSWQQYQKPATYRGIHAITIPRDKLPETGTYRLWLPIPINTGPQTQITIESITPDKWVKQPPSINEEIGLLYMEIPMEELSEDLAIQVSVTFNHYEQRFSVNPANIGEYDKDSALYQKYTRSYGNTEITPDIEEMAKTIVGDEKNPYFAARKIYDYIVTQVDYAFMPHLIFWPRSSLTETDYVHINQRGDCGAQSMYFSAMCRSLGIPARTTGGWQLFKDEFSGHFWAEFYLPNYGWIPVDTSAAQLAYYPKNLTAQQRQIFIDYYFGNQDSMRCVVQNDTDLPLIPAAHGIILLPMAIQVPAVEYSELTLDLPDELFLEYYTIQCEKINP